MTTPRSQKVVGASAAVLAAIALCAPLVVKSEGVVTHTYIDPAGIPTTCVGHTGDEVKVGQTFTLDQCMETLRVDLLKHGVAIDRCIKVQIPVESRAAFTSFAFNAGAAAFCGSTMARKLNAGDLAGACAQLSLWVKARKQGVVITLPGLVKRRADERAYCERGLA